MMTLAYTFTKVGLHHDYSPRWRSPLFVVAGGNASAAKRLTGLITGLPVPDSHPCLSKAGAKEELTEGASLG